MLVEFSVSNFKSYKNKQTLSMVSKDKNVAFSTNIKKIPYLLNRTTIMGPNASGKSNLIQAMVFMKDFITRSYNAGIDELINVIPYALNKNFKQKPSEFEIIFTINQDIIQYGFSTTQTEIVAEWLYVTPKNGNIQCWFERGKNNEKDSWYINPKIKGSRKEWILECRRNSLLLSIVATLKNQEDFKRIVQAFLNNIHILSSTTELKGGFSQKSCHSNNKMKSKILSFLKEADLGISDLETKEEIFNPDQLPSDLPEILKNKIINDLTGAKKLNLFSLHKMEDGSIEKFDFKKMESEGTKKMFVLSGPIQDVLDNGYTFIIDELDKSLHFKELEFILNKFSNSTTNPKNAQLIFTNHLTSVLNVLNREEIYLADKKDGFSTELVPLNEFENRKDNISIERRYRSGAYAAIPKIGKEG